MFEHILRRGVAEVIVEEELKELLCSKRELRIKLGLDPSRPDIHLGHAVVLRKVRKFQELGHKAVLIIGDWTAQIGDPSGQASTRPMLSEEEVKENAKTYLSQFFKIVDKDRTEIRWQSEWFSGFSLKDVIGLISRFTLSKLLAREDFQKRLSIGNPISLSELVYPLLQAYDSVAIRADVEFGGIDQKFNCLIGREMQKMMGQPPQQILLVPLLIGLDGKQKMSKSLGNYIGITEPPDEMYGKIMSLPDELILPYLELLTDIPDGEIEEYKMLMESGGINPMEVKKRLAYEVVLQFHNKELARMAQEKFERVFQKRKLPEDVAEFKITDEFFRMGRDFVDLLVASGMVASRSQGKREIIGGAVEIDGRRVRDINEAKSMLKDGVIIRVGKRRFIRLRFSG